MNEMESDVLVALLSELPFNSFMEDGTELLAYIERSLLDTTVIHDLKDISESYNVSYTIISLPDKDWNKEWESNFDPVFVENICTIIAPFHENTKILGQRIVLSPKMAFGTGHHYTTHGMIVQMNNLDMKHKKVLDFGSGTGLLAIYVLLVDSIVEYTHFLDQNLQDLQNFLNWGCHLVGWFFIGGYAKAV